MGCDIELGVCLRIDLDVAASEVNDLAVMMIWELMIWELMIREQYNRNWLITNPIEVKVFKLLLSEVC